MNPIVQLFRQIRGGSVSRPAPGAPVPVAASAGGLRTIESSDEQNLRDQIEQNYRPMCHSFDEIRRIATALRDPRRLDARPLHRFLLPFGEALTPVVGLRIDVDADPWTAVRMAREFASHGVASSVFLLHTAAYYGRFEEGPTPIFLRNSLLRPVVRDLIVAGAEIGMHNDVMGVAARAGIDACAAFLHELQWLRSLGAFVRGTVGHNSIRAYGAENAEVFAERVLADDSVDPRRSELPIGRLREAELSLLYEGTFSEPRTLRDPLLVADYIRGERPASVRDEGWMRTYLVNNPLHGWRSDYQLWAIGGGNWVFGGSAAASGRSEPRFAWNVRIDEAIRLLEDLPPGSRTLVVMHPEYFIG